MSSEERGAIGPGKQLDPRTEVLDDLTTANRRLSTGAPDPCIAPTDRESGQDASLRAVLEPDRRVCTIALQDGDCHLSVE